MERRKGKPELSIFTLPLLVLILLSFLSLPLAYGSSDGPFRSGSPAAVGTNSEEDEEPYAEDPESTDVDVVITDDSGAPQFGATHLSSSDKGAVSLRSSSGFDAFNAQYKNQWKSSFSEKSDKVKLLYGALSKRYESGPEPGARDFLKDSHGIFGLREDLSDLKTQRVDRTPVRNHVRFQQTYNGVPVVGAQVLVHSNQQGQVTMVQNDYVPELRILNQDLVAEDAARKTAQDDLRASLGQGATLSDSKAEKLIAPREGAYYYIWKITTPTRDPWGYWVHHINAQTGEVIYKANEILSLRTGKGLAYKDNAKWHSGIISRVPLKNMFTSSEGYGEGWLWGLHADIWDNNFDDPYSPTYTFYYNPFIEKDYFDATQAYYYMNTIWDWWDKKVVRKYGPYWPDYFYSFSIPVYVNVEGMCNAFYSPDIVGGGYPGFAFGDENSCAFGSEDLVIDNDVFRHEYTHAMMDWGAFDGQFGGPVDYYGRAMGEGNSDWFAFLYSPKDPLIADVAWAWSVEGYLRNLDSTRMYPWDVDYPAYGPEEHYTGEIWGGYLYDVYRVLKAKALPYVYQSFYYFSPAGGYMDGLPDFFDAIWAQVAAETDMTGKITSSAKAWGSMASRGINGALRAPYSDGSDYFHTGGAGSDDPAYFYFNFPPVKSVNTKSNLLLSGDTHEYVITTTSPGLDLTALVTGSSSNGLVNPNISLYTIGGGLLYAVGPSSSNKATLKYYNLSSGTYVVVVSGWASAPARGYYTFKVQLR
jgi:Zn-dependent metalloprotease